MTLQTDDAGAVRRAKRGNGKAPPVNGEGTATFHRTGAAPIEFVPEPKAKIDIDELPVGQRREAADTSAARYEAKQAGAPGTTKRQRVTQLADQIDKRLQAHAGKGPLMIKAFADLNSAVSECRAALAILVDAKRAKEEGKGWVTLVEAKRPDWLEAWTGDRWGSVSLPPRDWIVEGLFCTTSRMMVVGETGAGKTLFNLDLANAWANGARFLDWPTTRPMRVLYIEGELDGETVQERIRASNAIFGASPNLLVLSRDVLPDDAMPPLETEAGRQWLMGVIEAWKPDVIFYDSLAYLTAIDLKKPEEWAPVNELMKRIKTKRIGQVLVTHTGYDPTKSYGDAQKEWPHETVLMLAKPEGDDEIEGRIVMRFKKKRNGNAKNRHLYKSLTVQHLDAGWMIEGAAPKVGGKKRSQIDEDARRFVEAYSNLVKEEPDIGFAGEAVHKVRVEDIREHMLSRGWLVKGNTEREQATVRQQFSAAKKRVMRDAGFVELNGLIWRSR